MVTSADRGRRPVTKVSAEDLVVCGGAPCFREPKHVGAPNLGDRSRFFARLGGMLDRRWLTNDGPLVPEFEQAIARCTGARHCVATSNATAGLDLAARALGMRGEVIVPAFTFVAPVHALSWGGATPVFCDVDPATHLLNPDEVEALITPRTTGILGVHLWGLPCDGDRLSAIARRHGVPLLFDAAHAFGAARGAGYLAEGAATVFSFHATKIVNACEGGAVLTDDDVLAERLRAGRSFGFTGVDCVSALGINAKMSEAAAAMGLTSLESFETFAAANRRNYAAYVDGLRDLPGVSVRAPERVADTTHHYVVVEIDAASAGFTRDQAVRVLAAEGVRARRYFHPGCHRMEPYRLRPLSRPLPQTEWLCTRVLQLPTGTAVELDDVAAICAVLQLVSRHAAAIGDQLGPAVCDADPKA